jgi:hypothetical protein|nr:MAG TPA: hypothetical protein [Caudoviricetes sp.]
MAIAGRVAIVPKGDWSADATYKRLDAVTYNNTLYFAKKEVPAGTATSNTEYWSKSIVGGAGAIATKEDAGIVKPTDGLSIAEDGTLKVNIDGATLTMDQVNNVIKLSDTLKDKINGAFPAANLINNLTTTEAGFGLDARQGKALDDKITEINGSLKIKDVPWTPYCPRTDFADKVKFEEENAMQYGSLMICSIRIELLENTPGGYVQIVNLPKKMFRGINQTNMNGKTGQWYLYIGDNTNSSSMVLRDLFESGNYYFSFIYLTAE